MQIQQIPAFIMLISLLFSCNKDTESICKEFDFEGNWTVTSLTTVKNLDTYESTVSESEFGIFFFNNQEGYFARDSSPFIWGTHCYPQRLLISQALIPIGETEPSFYTTSIFLIKEAKSSDTIIYTSDQEDKIVNNEYIRTLREWTFNKE